MPKQSVRARAVMALLLLDLFGNSQGNHIPINCFPYIIHYTEKFINRIILNLQQIENAIKVMMLNSRTNFLFLIIFCEILLF